MFAGIALRAMVIALATLPAAGALVASADDGPPRDQDAAGRPSRTVLRPTELRPAPVHLGGSAHSGEVSGHAEPVRALPRSAEPPGAHGALPAPAPSRDTPPASELVLLVGGLASTTTDGAFDALAARFAADPRYELRRFGADPRHPYDTRGALDPSADALVAQIREEAPRYAAVHLVTHSMGGAVVDRAFERGLSARDGLRTVVSLAPPRSGATIARASTGVLAAAGEDAPLVRGILAPVHDPGLAAVRDLARGRPVVTAPPGVTRLDLRLATDALVLARDASAPGTDSRTLLPSTAGGLEGHGAILRDPRALALATATVTDGRTPPDDRSLVERVVTDEVASLDDRAVRVALLVTVAALLALVVALRVRRIVPPVLITPLAPIWRSR